MGNGLDCLGQNLSQPMPQKSIRFVFLKMTVSERAGAKYSWFEVPARVSRVSKTMRRDHIDRSWLYLRIQKWFNFPECRFRLKTSASFMSKRTLYDYIWTGKWYFSTDLCRALYVSCNQNISGMMNKHQAIRRSVLAIKGCAVPTLVPAWFPP